MTEEQIKEQLSRGFIRLVANRAGYKCKIDELDHGTDVTLSEVRARSLPTGKSRLVDTGRYVDLQLKCTCESSISQGEEGFGFELEAKTYNDIVERLSDPGAAPLLLVVFILPDDRDSWLAVSVDQLVLQRTAYWWKPPLGATQTQNTRSIHIDIPYANAVGLNFVPAMYAEWYP